MITNPHLSYELEHWSHQELVVGIDEVGRGCLAGPLVLGGVLFEGTSNKEKLNQMLTSGIRDSKQLSPKKREQLAPWIKENAFFYITSSISVEYINEFGIVKALIKGITEIMDASILNCPDKHTTFLIDGLALPHIPYRKNSSVEYIVKGDMKCLSIAAASVLAKVTRDEYMNELSKNNEHYGWHLNKGYGTAKHIQAIRQHGLTPHHRSLFVRNIFNS